MERFHWSTENDVYLAQVDAEHRDLFELGGQLQHTIEANAPPSEILEHLHRLSAHFEDHFTHEEWLMKSVAYPSYGWHREQHNTARRRLKLFLPMIESGDRQAAELFLEFLACWLQDHTSVTDKMMAAFVRNYERTHAINAFEREAKPSKARQHPAHV